jgi:replicative superfamily II helicase
MIYLCGIPSNNQVLQAYETLNRVQSIVYPIAYGTNENMLVCAPTGAVSYL